MSVKAWLVCGCVCRYVLIDSCTELWAVATPLALHWSGAAFAVGIRIAADAMPPSRPPANMPYSPRRTVVSDILMFASFGLRCVHRRRRPSRMTADQNTPPHSRLLAPPSFVQATPANRTPENSWLARLCDDAQIRSLGKTSGYDPVTMTHSAEPDDEETHRWGAYAPIVSRAATLAPTVISVVALGIAIWALTSPRSDTPPAPTAQQVTEAKGRACDAYGRARTAVALQTRTEVGTDPTAAQAVAANAR